MQEATTSDEKVQRIQKDGSIISETEVDEEIPPIKNAETIDESETNPTDQTDLFDTKNPPLE